MRNPLFIFFLSVLLLSNCAPKTHTVQSLPSGQAPEPPRRVEILFLGHNSEHHHSAKYAPVLAPALFKKGINLTYTESREDLNQENLRKYDGLIIYANHDSISSSQEKALLEFVEGGKGLIPIHSASFCFRNSDPYVKLVGGQFKSHGTGTFTAQITNPQHPVMQGLAEFETWDETYVHSQINPDMTVLMERVEGAIREPWTWVRNQGQGRVFYTAFGHDERTWQNPGFQQLIGNGVLWAVGEQAKDQLARLNLPTAVYTEAEIPNYENRNPPPMLQAPFSAAESQKLIQVPVDFEVELFAAEPDIINPITMAWDEKGRLWVVETVDYPNTVRDEEGVGDDRIKICEDTDGDGKADKFTVFAEDLNIPTSMVFVNGGVVVAQAPHFLFLKDTDGDDQADVREVLMTGWGKSDTHAGPSNLRYGLDNQLWGVLGYSGFNGKIGTQNMRFGQGVYRFTPDGQQLEFLGRTSNNTWGLGFSEDFDVFISTANNTHSAFLSVPNQYLKRVLVGGNDQAVQKIDGHYDMHVVTPNLRQVDVHGGFTAAAGHSLYTARNFPKPYWNRIAFVCEPTGRVIHNAILEPKGAGFAEEDGWNFLASSDEWVGPVQAEVGPDGAVWVLDWYDFIIQHNPTPRGFENGEGNAYINPLRDKEHGRIYRIKYKQAKPYTPIQLSKDDPEGLLAALESDNMFWRTTAQRLLVEANSQAALPGLYKIINDQKVDEIGLNAPALHALWTLHGLGALEGANAEAIQVATRALSHPAAGVRKAAAQVLPKNQETFEGIRKAGLLNDQDLRVRLASLLVMADLPASPAVGKLLYAASQEPEAAADPSLSQALFAAALTHQAGFLEAQQQDQASARAEAGDSSLTQLIGKALREETYPLPNRSQVLTQYAPDVRGKEINIWATVSKGEKDLEGVIMAHGGKDQGYGLFVQNGKLNMVVRQGGQIYKATSSKPLPDKFDVVARLKKNGAMSIEVDGALVAKGKAAQLFEEPLTAGLRVGLDYNDEDKIGDYQGSYYLNGNLTNASLALNKPGEATKPAAGKAASAKAAKSTAAKGTGLVTQPAPANKTGSGKEDDVTITLKVVEHVMQFDKKAFTVKVGQKVNIIFENPDFMQHNLLFLSPDSLQKVGAAADVLARDPKGAEQDYVPQMPEVLHATRLLNPEGRVTLQFTAPNKAGDYPYVCTFPGHWRIMNGVMKVEAAAAE